MKSPKAEFLLNPVAVTEHASLISRGTVDATLNVALLEMVYRQVSTTSEAAAQNAFRLDGAKQFLTIFLNLSKTETAKPKTQGLDYGS